MWLRTISARQRERLERTVDERHGLALMGSREEVRQLRVNLKEEEYQHFLEKEVLILRVNTKRAKIRRLLSRQRKRESASMPWFKRWREVRGF
jgi:hypothetical protein